MDLSNLISIYGKPDIIQCPDCEGAGCENCQHFGYIAKMKNSNITLAFKHPLYILLKKRERLNLIKNVSLIVLTVGFIFAIIVSYIVNIVNG